MSDETCCGACGYPVHATKEMACDWCRQAADRIEELVKEVERRIEELEAKLATCEKYRDAYAEMGRIGTQAVRDLEIKLAKAAEALDMLVRDCEADYPPSHGAIKHFAIAALAELKGESHE